MKHKPGTEGKEYVLSVPLKPLSVAIALFNSHVVASPFCPWLLLIQLCKPVGKDILFSPLAIVPPSFKCFDDHRATIKVPVSIRYIFNFRAMDLKVAS